jgi:hypothetical protein
VRKLVLLFCFLLAGCARVPRPMLAQSMPAEPPYSAWQRVLERYVDDLGRVNFAALAGDRADLNLFVAWVYDNGPNNHPERFPTRNHLLAFHLNAYNALAMHKVLEAGVPTTLAGLRKIGFFYFGKVQVGGEAITLYDYENKVIRPLGEPRVHLALNCMSVSCPRLPREPFLPKRLEEQLAREAKRFFNDSRNVQVDNAKHVLRLSEILQFYTADFLAVAPSLASYVNRYRVAFVPENYEVEFIPYDWTINRQPGT